MGAPEHSLQWKGGELTNLGEGSGRHETSATAKPQPRKAGLFLNTVCNGVTSPLDERAGNELSPGRGQAGTMKPSYGEAIAFEKVLLAPR